MSRLRVRVELNRGGVGVPLHKLSSVVQEAERFFQMLAQDVRIETNNGEWLAFDFDNESLNFTAEFVGPVSPEQVVSFSAAFDGTTPLRRATIAQFTRITEAIGQDELIGFGLYHSDQEMEPSEWRCLSRRDALRIADEMQVLLEASGESDQETRLPAVIDHDTAARLFKERHERIPIGLDYSRMPELMREIEASLSKRIARLEGEVEDHSQSIGELKELSGATEHSFRNLLASVESFCAQATRQLERITPPAQIAAPSQVVPEPVRAASISQVVPEPVRAASISQAVPESVRATSIRQPAAVMSGPLKSTRGWRSYAIAAILIIGVVSAVVFIWSPKSGESTENQVAAASAPRETAPPQQTTPSPAVATPPVPVARSESARSEPARSPAAKTTEENGVVMHVEIEAREPAWVAVTDATGRRLIAKTFEANETESVDLTGGALLRTGNAGGLVVRVNGKELGPLGPTGKIRDISFKNGGYKIHAPDAG